MASKDQTMSAAERLVAEARKHQTDREKTYRGQALKMYPWVCGRCSPLMPYPYSKGGLKPRPTSITNIPP
jgi:hypothetical protein